MPSYKYLGVILDPLLTFKLHLNFVSKTVAYKTYKLCNLRPFLSRKLALNIFTATIVPYFDYADILFVTTHENLLKPLQFAPILPQTVTIYKNRLKPLQVFSTTQGKQNSKHRIQQQIKKKRRSRNKQNLEKQKA